jgi:LEA14-like dessication related protein
MATSHSPPEFPMIRTWLPGASLTLLSLLALAGCTSIGKDFQTPRLKVISVQPLSADMFAQRFTLRVLVENPNDVEVPVRGLDYQLFLMGDTFAEGVSNESFVLPALGEAEFDMTVTTNFISALGRLVSRAGGARLDKIDYEITGKIFIEKGMVRKIPFSERGVLDFEQALGGAKRGERGG